MTKVTTPKSGGLPLHRRMHRWLELKFTRHEMWTLRTASGTPIFALFALGPLLAVWCMLPMALLGALSVLAHLHAGVFGFIVALLLSVGGLAVYATWLIRWCFICMFVMFGRTKMAQSKEAELDERLKRLQGWNRPRPTS